MEEHMEREKVINDARKKAEGYFQRGEFFVLNR